MKIILFGGSFDPPHLGHKKIIKECLKYKFDKFILMPSYKSPLKTTSTLSSKNHRLEMLSLLINDLENIIGSKLDLPNFKSHFRSKRDLTTKEKGLLNRLLENENYKKEYDLINQNG